MRAFIAFAILPGLIGVAANAQGMGGSAPPASSPTDRRGNCSGITGAERSRCMADAKRPVQPTDAGKLSSKDAKLINETAAAAQAKMTAGDFAGAVTIYQQAIDAGTKSPALYRLTAGLAVAQRRQAVAAYNAGPRPTYPPAGSTNDQIRAANAANAAIQAQKTGAALPLLRKALETASRAATQADAQKDRTADELIGMELREDAGLLYALDHDAVVATPRATIDTEATWFTRWFDATNPLAEALAAKYGFATAAALTAKDKTAGLALADKVRARTGSDVDGLLGYADILITAKVPVADPRWIKALADLTAAEPTVADSQQRATLKRLKAALAAAS